MHKRGACRLAFPFRFVRRPFKALFLVCFCFLSVKLFLNTPKHLLSETKHEITPPAISTSKSIGQYKSPKQCLPVEKNFLRPHLDLRIIILTYNRPKSLLRLLNSLNNAQYGGSKVAVEIWVDRDRNRQYSEETVRLALNFTFDHGPCDIHVQNQKEGKNGQWFHTWRSYNDTNEIAVIFEDNLTVSPYFYKWLKIVHSSYGGRNDVIGFSLQGQQIRHNDSTCCLNVPKESKVFLYTTFGTTGFSPNNKQWKEYIEWSPEVRQKKAGLPAKRRTHAEWEKYSYHGSLVWALEYILYTWTNKLFTVYPNFKDNKGLTYRWSDVELNSAQKKTKSGNETERLLLLWKHEYEDLPDKPICVNSTGIIIPPK